MNPWLHGLLWGAVVVSGLMGFTAYATWFERKFAGRIQSRMGPTYVGPWGLLQPIADAFKLLQKEDIVPQAADKTLFNLAPPLTLIFALSVAAVVPFSPGLLASDMDIGVLWILAISGLMVFPVWMAGWASNNKYALLGGMRAVAQGISYEIPLVMSAMVPVVLADSMSLSDIIKYQTEHGWFAFWPIGPGAVAFVIFFLASLAEANRIPFDIPEAESELVSGPSTEYTGMKFGLFYMAEYLHTFLVSAIAAALFFGGWDGPFWDGLLWMVLKAVGFFVFLTWIRWSLVRFRSDQLMDICWKYLVPISLVTLLWAAIAVHVGGMA